PNAKVVLAMPNTPLLLGCGATALATEAPVSDAEFAVVRRIFDACGMTAVIEPAQMKEIIAINGSSPAFIYLFAKGFLDYAEQVGLSGDVAKELFAQSLIGSAKMITDSGYSIAELIRQVSSPGGTTLAGLDRFYAGNLTDVVQDACDHCTRRAYELAK
ncbi:MAG: pyrroline-5-carboxylate reductase family protein, partial [Ruminococcus sp.]